MFARKSPPPQLNLGPNNTTRDVPDTTSATPIEQSNLNKPLPKSPASSKLSTFFGWATSPSPTTATDYSDKSFSPLPSPSSPKPATAVTESYGTPIASKGPIYANAPEQNPLQYCEGYLQTPADSTTSLGQLEEMEDELKAISAELASSIRREMDLEDLVERLQEQINNPQAPGKRTSDYFSDSGYSSAKFSDYDQAKEEISQIQRRAEQEKAQIRLELTSKLQDERSKRRQLDQQIQELSKKASQLDVAQLNSNDASSRVKELEAICEDLSRRLSEERQVKNNFEDLLGALKGELQTASNERDNLRDEIVPQLRARVEGLEAEAAEHARLTYDTSKMQQELQLLRSENAELKQTGTRMSMALSRSASVTGGSFRKTRPQSISRSNSTRPTEPREVLAERLKDVEAQRDALHSALRSLLERQELQNRENAKRIRQLEMERDRLLTASPKKAGYEREVSILRDEISVLRRRAEEAIEQKWQVEKGLAGLKMDLDRAEGEIASLRSLLQEKDILIPEALARPGSSHSEDAVPVSSDSLEQAYQDLQAAYMDALERIKSLEQSTRTDEKTQLAMQRLEHSLSAAISDRDLARSEASSYLNQLSSLQALEKEHLDTERDLAAQLHDSARRVEELAAQVRAQLEANATLRTRLADTIARGEAEQRVNTDRIAGMQARLRTLEDQVVSAQTAAEERVARHEEDLAALRDAHSAQLHRLRDAPGSLRGERRVFPPKSPLSPIFSLNSVKQTKASSSRMSNPLIAPHNSKHLTPRPALRRSASEPVDGDMSAQIETLKRRVAELEGALASADAEMQEVVGRMSAAQIEVLRLQEEREEAVRETRKLRKVVEEERLRVFEGRWRGLSSGGMVE
jgi:chromosome segregation ATPase